MDYMTPLINSEIECVLGYTVVDPKTKNFEIPQECIN